MILLADAIDLPVLDERSRFESENRHAIDANWREEIANTPRLWNGTQFLFENVRVEDGVLRGTGYRTDFATFMFWRKNRDAFGDGPIHIAGTTVPVTSDGALLTIRMSQHTANPGEYYFPAGSLDDHDLVDGHISIDANVTRELLEETGISAALQANDLPYIIAVDRGAWHIGRRFDLGMDLAQARAVIADHQRMTGDDETDAALGVFDREQATCLKLYARMLADWHFDNLREERAA